MCTADELTIYFARGSEHGIWARLGKLLGTVSCSNFADTAYVLDTDQLNWRRSSGTFHEL